MKQRMKKHLRIGVFTLGSLYANDSDRIIAIAAHQRSDGTVTIYISSGTFEPSEVEMNKCRKRWEGGRMRMQDTYRGFDIGNL
jgi:hypothetical protein